MSAATAVRGRIVELFASVQGEGLWVGKPQVFVRFHGCKLHCAYCDTPATHKLLHSSRIEEVPFSAKFKEHSLEYTTKELDEVLAGFGVRSLALTGGEPLEQVDFLVKWLEHSGTFYETLLETSGVEVEALRRLRSLVTIVSADIKIPTATKEAAQWSVHDEFLRVAEQGPGYAKLVYNELMTDEEVGQVEELINRHPQVPFIFQPESPLRHRNMSRCIELFTGVSLRHPDRVRLIPQVHKSLSIL